MQAAEQEPARKDYLVECDAQIRMSFFALSDVIISFVMLEKHVFLKNFTTVVLRSESNSNYLSLDLVKLTTE